jgi:hypothetical protein
MTLILTWLDAVQTSRQTHLMKLQRLQNKVPHYWQFSKAHTGPRFAHRFQNSVYDYITKLCRQQAEVIQNHDNENIRNTGQGEG